MHVDRSSGLAERRIGKSGLIEQELRAVLSESAVLDGALILLRLRACGKLNLPLEKRISVSLQCE